MKKNNDSYHMLVDEIEDYAILLLDEKGNIKDWNKGAEKLKGYKAEEIIGKNFRVFYTAEDIERDLPGKLMERAIKEGKATDEGWRVRKDGICFWGSILITALHDEKNTLVGFSKITRDLTERKHLEDKLTQANKELEKRIKERSSDLEKSIKEISDYKYALDQSSIVAITDQKGIIKYVNDNFCKISKYSREELIGQDHRIINSGYHPKEFIRDLWVTIANGKIWKGELKNRAKDGTIYWVDTTIVPFLNEQGKPYQYVAIRADITGKKEAEEKQQKTEEEVLKKTAELAGIFERISDGFIVLDKNLRYKYLNKRVGEMVGRDPASLIGKYVWDEFPDAIESATYHAFNKALSEQKYIYNLDYYPPLNLWQENHIYPSNDGLSVFIRDVSEQKIAEEKINEMNRDLEKKILERTAQLEIVNKELDGFSYSVSHDLRAPLRAINGYAKMLEEDYSHALDDEGKRLLRTVEDNAKKMGVLIDDLLAFSRLGKKEIVKSRVKMTELAMMVLEDISNIVPHNAVVKINTLEDSIADGSMIKQVLVNLLSNAIKYSSHKANPEIEISSFNEDNETVYRIKDNGAGFDMQYSNKLFGVFQRLHSVEQFEGTGVGLALVKRIITRHGGRVWAQGEVDKGATFYFSLPIEK